jgi:predicted AlkP superfamily phosphohydrolase/phosphomutase
LREIARKEALCAWLLERERWDLFMVVFGESDTASHHFWRFHDPESPRHPGHPGPFDDTIRAVYRRLDAAVGRLAALGEHVCVVSDHGFGGAGTQVLYLNRFLERHGWLRFRSSRAPGEGAHPGARAREVLARGLDRLRTAAMRLPLEKLLRRLPAGATGRVETAARWGDIDFKRTRAWSDELNYAATVHLNVRGRDPRGLVEDRDRAIQELSALLLGWEEDGKPVVARVYTREEAHAEDPAAPDLLLELALEDGYSRTLLPSARVASGTTSRRLTPAELDGGKGLGMNGSHRSHGVLMLQGPNVERTGHVSHLRDDTLPGMEDVAPTLMALLGEAPTVQMEGRVLPLLRGSDSWGGAGLPPRNAPPSRSAKSTRAAEPGSAAPSGASADEDALRKRLERLGYL